MKVRIPYGAQAQILDQELADAEVLESGIGNLKAEDTEDNLVKKAMAEPIGSPKLSELAKGKKNITIIVSDHTRPVPSKHILPFMLEELRQGSPDADITLLVATAFHRASSREELIHKMGEKIVNEEKIVVHNCRSEEDNVEIGVLPSGAHLVINKLAANADLLVAEGFIEPHLFAGFSGGRKSVLPGVCSQVTVLGNHCSKFIASPYSRTGILEGNPIHRDMLEAGRLAKLAYIVNVVVDEEQHVAAAFAGDFIKAHEAGCAFLKSYCRVQPQQLGDIVITSNGGAPMDQNIYQTVKCMTAAELAIKEGGIMIVCSYSADGTGGETFYNAIKNCATPQALLDEIALVPMEETKPDQWEYQIMARILNKAHVIYVTQPSLKEIVAEMKMEYAPDVNTAYEMAAARVGKDAHVVVIPNGLSVIVTP